MDTLEFRNRLSNYVDCCRKICGELGPDDSRVTRIHSPRRLPGLIAERAERSPDFPIGTPSSASSTYDLLCENHETKLLISYQECQAFFRNTGLYHEIVKGAPLDLDALTDRLCSAVTMFGRGAINKSNGHGVPQDYSNVGTGLVAIEGLDISERSFPLADGQRIIKPTTTELAALLAADTIDAFSEEAERPRESSFGVSGAELVKQLSGFSFLETTLHDFHPDDSQWTHLQAVRDAEDRWIPTFQLLSSSVYKESCTTRPIARFMRWRSPLVYPPIVLDEENRLRLLVYEKSESLLWMKGKWICLDADAKTRERFGKISALRHTTRGHTKKIERALHFFSRASKELVEEDDEMMVSMDPNPRRRATIERAFLGLIICMECIFLGETDAGGPKRKLANRLASLLASSDQTKGKLFERICGFYELRNTLVHSEEAPHLGGLWAATGELHEWTRLSLLALLSLSGDRARVLKGERPEAREVRERNRQDVSFVLTPEERKFIDGVSLFKDEGGADWFWSGILGTDRN